MRKSIVALCLFCAASAAAGDAPTGLDRLALLLPGTWKTEGQTLDSPVSKAGPQHYTTRRDCWREPDAYKCVSVVNGTLQLYDVYGWDAAAGVYHQTRVTPQGRQPDFTVTVQGGSWTFQQDITRADGSTAHLRIVRSLAGATASYDESFSLDGKAWVDVAKGVDTRLDPAQ